MITATYDPLYGFVRVYATGVAPGYHLYRLSPVLPGYGTELPAFDYTVDAVDQVAVDYLAPLGAEVVYGLARTPADRSGSEQASVRTPANTAFMRHLFYPTLASSLRVVSFEDSRPSRLTTYAVSGTRNAMATYDVRAGRDATLEIAVDGKAERDLIERIIADGAPVSFGMCNGLGNDVGVFAIGETSFARIGKKDRWVVTFDLTEVDMPRILESITTLMIPGRTYDDREAELGNGTYDDAALQWRFYWQALGV